MHPHITNFSRAFKALSLSFLSVIIFPSLVRASQFREDIHSKLLAGERFGFDPKQPRESRLVKAEWIREAADRHVRISITGAVIRGHLNLSYEIFNDEVRFSYCTFEGVANFSAATFNKDVEFDATFENSAVFASATFERAAHFYNSRFRDADFTDVRAKGQFDTMGSTFENFASFDKAEFGRDARFVGSTFSGSATFEASEFRGKAIFDQVVFRKYAGFDNAHFLGEAHFGGIPHIRKTNAHFYDRAYFRFVRFDSFADFRGVSFEGEAVFLGLKAAEVADYEGAIFRRSVTFENAEFSSDASFSGAAFGGAANFFGTHIKGAANFSKSRTAGPCIFHDSAQFYSTEIDGQFDMQGGTVFKKMAIFSFAKFRGPLDLDDAIFEGQVYFTDTQFLGISLFRGTRFNGSADFRYAKFLDISEFGSNESKQVLFAGDTNFTGTLFQRSVIFQNVVYSGYVSFSSARFESKFEMSAAALMQPADFTETHFQGPAYFGARRTKATTGKDSVLTLGEVKFDHAQFENDAHFEYATFSGPVSFRGTQFHSVFLSATGFVAEANQFSDTIDLRGCVYDHIQADWNSLLRFPDGRTRQYPYDRQPYIQLEQISRAAGLEGQADEIYVEQMKVKTRTERWSTRWYDELFGKILNYGAGFRPWGVAAVIIIIGALYFRIPTSLVRSGDIEYKNYSPSILDCLLFSLRQFLPFEMPFPSTWKPCPDRVRLAGIPLLSSATVGNFIRLSGWILVPILVLIMVGVIHRAPK